MRLAAFEQALTEDVTARTGAQRARARAEAEALVDRARHDAEALVERARAEGVAEAERETARELLEARRGARRLGLEAAQAAYQRLHRSALEAVRALREDPAYPALLDRLEVAARSQLGPAAVIARDPPEGGVIGEAGGRRVDYSLPALVHRAIEAMAGDIAGTWA